MTAYASASYISVGSNSDSGNNSSETTEESTYTEVSETVWATEGVNIRSGAGTNFNVLTILRKDASIQRVAVGSNGWSKVKYGNAEGYIKSEFLTTTNPNPTTATGNAVVDYAMQFLGNPYVYAGNDLNTGVDCSGFTQQVYLHFGVTLNRIADDQRYNGISVPVEEAQPGDLFFYGSNGYATHVALYIGDGKVIHASTPETGIIISNFDYRTPMQVNRIMIQ